MSNAWDGADSGDRRVLAFSTKGAGSNDEERIASLLQHWSPELFHFRRTAKLQSALCLLRRVLASPPDLLVMEGTGIAGGLACMLGKLLARVPYIVSSGDAVGPWVGSQYPLLGALFGLYERLLCAGCAGFIGWTPYLVGRALAFGAPRAMTAAGWAPFGLSARQRIDARRRIREGLGIPADALVVGLIGSLAWNRRVGYCYGMELVQAIARTRQEGVRVLIVGEGSGLERLRRLSGDRLGRTVHLPGAVAAGEVGSVLAALDVGSLPQSVDRLGSYRYTTKLSEYLAAGLPVVTGEIPLAYDLDDGWLWRMPGRAPWDQRYVNALASWMDALSPQAIAAKRADVPREATTFDRSRQVHRATQFLADILGVTLAQKTRGAA